jgi:hypothetical protein
MNSLRVRSSWLVILVWLVVGGACVAAGRASSRVPVPAKSPAFTLLPLLENVPEPYQRKARSVIEKPAMYARGPVESFRCQAQTYRWLLEHPDRTVRAWRRLGARNMYLADRGVGKFGRKE